MSENPHTGDSVDLQIDKQTDKWRVTVIATGRFGTIVLGCVSALFLILDCLLVFNNADYLLFAATAL